MKFFFKLIFVLVLLIPSFVELNAQDEKQTNKIINLCGARFNVLFKEFANPIDISPLCTSENSSEVYIEFKDFSAVIDNKMVVRVIFFPESKNFVYKGITMTSNSQDIMKKIGKPEKEIERAEGRGYLWEYSLDEIFSNLYFWFDADMKLEKISVELR